MKGKFRIFLVFFWSGKLTNISNFKWLFIWTDIFKVQVALVICGLFICEFAYMRLKNGLFSGTYPLIYSDRWSFYMQIHYMRAYFWSPYLSHITRSTCMWIHHKRWQYLLKISLTGIPTAMVYVWKVYWRAMKQSGQNLIALTSQDMDMFVRDDKILKLLVTEILLKVQLSLSI